MTHVTTSSSEECDDCLVTLQARGVGRVTRVHRRVEDPFTAHFGCEPVRQEDLRRLSGSHSSHPANLFAVK